MAFLDHPFVSLAVFGLLVALLLAYAFGEKVGRRRRVRSSRWPAGQPVISLDWVNGVPVAVLECDGSLSADVVAWLDAVKDGPVLHV